MRVLCLCITLTFCTVSPAEPLGSGFSYQGDLVVAGEPANGVYDFQFDLTDAATGAAYVASPFVVEDVVVQNGIFTVEIDFGGVLGTDLQYWLEIGVRDGNSVDAYTILAPRQKLYASPLRNSEDASGDITAVTAGTGLLGGGTTGDVDLSVNPGYVQSLLMAQPWHAHGSVEFAASSFVAGAAGGTHGWALSSSGAPAISAVFELPPTYGPGSDIAIEIAWAGGSGNLGACTAVFRGMSPAGLQIGSPTMQLPWEWAGGDGSSDLVVDVPAPPSANGLDAVIQVSTMLVDGTGLQAGDTLSVTFVRFAVDPDDTCSDSLYVTSLSAGPPAT